MLLGQCVCTVWLEFQCVDELYIWFSLCHAVTTLHQRLLQPDFQPICASQLYPRHKHLLIKRSLRCRVSNDCKTSLAGSQDLDYGKWALHFFLKEIARMLLVVETLQPNIGSSMKRWGRLSHLWCDDNAATPPHYSKTCKYTNVDLQKSLCVLPHRKRRKAGSWKVRTGKN